MVVVFVVVVVAAMLVGGSRAATAAATRGEEEASLLVVGGSSSMGCMLRPMRTGVLLVPPMRVFQLDTMWRRMLLLVAMRVTMAPLCAAAMAVPAASAAAAVIMPTLCHTPAVAAPVRVATAASVVVPAAPAAAVVMSEVTMTQHTADDEIKEDTRDRHDEHD